MTRDILPILFPRKALDGHSRRATLSVAQAAGRRGFPFRRHGSLANEGRGSGVIGNIGNIERRFGTRHRHLAWACVDATAWATAIIAATATRLSITVGGLRQGHWHPGQLLMLSGLCAAITLLLSLTPRFHHMRSRRGSAEDARNVVLSWLTVVPIAGFANYFMFGRPVPSSAFLLSMPLALTLMLGARMVWRLALDSVRRPQLDESHARVVVLGAGRGGEQIIRAMLHDPDSGYVPVALLDDDPAMTNRLIEGVRVLGTRHDLVEVTTSTRATELLIAIPTAGSELVREMDAAATMAGLTIRVLPTTSELLGMLSLDDIRELTPADLLGRDEVSVDIESILAYIQDKRVLVTGAGGSIGSELCRQLAKLSPSELFLLDRDETALHSVQLSMEGKALLDTPNLIVADIRDTERIEQVFAFYKPDVVFHTAALKHLTLLENNPDEGMKTNVWGTKNLLNAALRHDVAHFVNVSTDKAADPTSVLGATKLMAERLTAQAAAEASGTFVSVRFGNVLGSRGSVLPTFVEQIKIGGPITITHPDVTRYFMTIPEAVRLILQAGAIGEAGEIMILDMGEPVKIKDLADRLIQQSGKEIAIDFTGLRPGEKLHEILISQFEVGVTRAHKKINHTVGSTDLDIRPLLNEELAKLVSTKASVS